MEKLIPQLRFPEFKEEWNRKKLGSFITFSKGKGISKSDIETRGLNECIRYGELYTKYNEVISSIHSRTNVSKNNSILSKENDVLIPSSGETSYDIARAAAINMKGVILGGDINILRGFENGNFAAYYLSGKRKLALSKFAEGNSVVHLYNEEIKKLVFFTPSLEEQTKIANFLGKVDKQIELLTTKKEKLEAYKKGIMQQLFNQELRFKKEDGSNYPNWEEKKLGYIAEIVGGGTPSTTNDNYWNGEINWFTPSEIRTKYALTSERKISEEGLSKSSAKMLPIGTILFCSRATIGTASILLRESTTNQGFQSFIVNENNSNEFLYYWIDLNKNAFIRLASGSTFLEISKKKIEGIDLLVPCLEEQTKIANFLSAIDRQIEQVDKQIDKSKAFKKGLLQQMFV